LGTKKMFQINYLLRDRIFCKGDLVRRPSNGAAVELSGRAGLGFADA
jgi:hypothetical protein